MNFIKECDSLKTTTEEFKLNRTTLNKYIKTKKLMVISFLD